MEFDRKRILQSAGDRLEKLREQFGFSRKQMAEYLNKSDNAYYKNESGQYLLGLKSLYRLSEDQDLSMDWYFFGRGPVNFKEKGIAEELIDELEKSRRKVTELAEKNAELEKKSDELAQHNEALAQEARENHQKEGEIRRLAAAKPGIGELLSHMEHIPLLYHEIMTHFHRFKSDNKEMVESSLTAPSSPE